MTKLFQTSFFISLIAVEYSAFSTVSIPLVEHNLYTFNYFIAFFILYLLFDSGFKIFTTLGKVSLLLFFAVQIELVQFFISNRYFSFLDIVADIVGIVVAIAIMKFYNQYIKVKDTSYIKL